MASGNFNWINLHRTSNEFCNREMNPFEICLSTSKKIKDDKKTQINTSETRIRRRWADFARSTRWSWHGWIWSFSWVLSALRLVHSPKLARDIHFHSRIRRPFPMHPYRYRRKASEDSNHYGEDIGFHQVIFAPYVQWTTTLRKPNTTPHRTWSLRQELRELHDWQKKKLQILLHYICLNQFSMKSNQIAVNDIFKTKHIFHIRPQIILRLKRLVLNYITMRLCDQFDKIQTTSYKFQIFEVPIDK